RRATCRGRGRPRAVAPAAFRRGRRGARDVPAAAGRRRRRQCRSRPARGRGVRSREAVISPLSPVLGGEGPGVRGALLCQPKEGTPHPQPLSPEYRGEGSKAEGRAVTPSYVTMFYRVIAAVAANCST